jgi:hypothetical protein
MSDLVLQPLIAPSVETLIVPVPRTNVIAEVWGELAYALGVSESQIENIIKRGFSNYLLASATIVFLNQDDEVPIEFVMTMDWHKHEMLAKVESNIDLCPSEPFTEQLDSNFRKMIIYLRRIVAECRIVRVTLQVRFRAEIYREAKRLAQARHFLGVSPAPPHNHVRGERLPDTRLRFDQIPETEFTIREICPSLTIGRWLR